MFWSLVFCELSMLEVVFHVPEAENEVRHVLCATRPWEVCDIRWRLCSMRSRGRR